MVLFALQCPPPPSAYLNGAAKVRCKKGEPWKAASYALIKSSRWICAIRNTLVSNPTSSSVLGTVTVFAPETTTAEVLTM
jgi:hypothetical protein